MNNIPATVSSIKNIDNLHIVEFDFNGIVLKMMGLELHPKVKIGTKVELYVKSTHISLSKDLNSKISHSNRIEAIIQLIKKGELLSSIKLSVNDITLEAIILTSILKELCFKEKDRVIMYIQESELSIGEIYG